MYFQTISKKKKYSEDLGSLLRQKYIWIYLLIEGFLGAIMFLLYITTYSSPFKLNIVGVFVDLNFLNNLNIVFIITTLIWTAIFTMITVLRYRKTYDTDWVNKNIKSLPWYIGETTDTLLILNMDHYFLDEDTEGNYFRNILHEHDMSFFNMDQIPEGSPFINHFKEHLETIRDIRMRTLFQLAISEISFAQLRLENREFFIKADYWNYYQNTTF